MKRAPAKQSVLVPTRVCARPECGKALTKIQKKFCSHSCRSLVLSPGNNGGAPDMYKPEYATTKFREYIALCEKESQPTLIPTQSSYIVLPNVRLPSNADYAEFLEVHPNTLDNWAGAHIEFAHTLDRLHRIQKIWLLNNGLAGKYNPTITKLQLNVNHGMVERGQVDNTHKMIGIVKHVYALADEMMQQKRLDNAESSQ